MKIEKLEDTDKGRVLLVQGKVSGRDFAMSIFVDGSGVIFEFHDDIEEKYVLSTDELVVEILKEILRT